ncbi:MAG: hypothetical protein WCQ95_09615 [Bacteroidota bacterium]
MIHTIRNFFWKSDIKKETAKLKRAKSFISLEQAKTIGILYNVGDEKDYITVTNLFVELQQQKKEVRTLGLIPYKDHPHYCYPRLLYDYITLKNINWYKKPFGEKIRDFMHKDFDILFNLDTTQNPALTYVYALSHAKFKVAIENTANKEFADLMIATKDTVSTTDLYAYMLNYVKMFTEKS